MVKELLIAMSLSLAISITAKAENENGEGSGSNGIGLIESGTTWECEERLNAFSDMPMNKIVQTLDGTEEINGKTYIKLWVSTNDHSAKLRCYIRVDAQNGYVYALDPIRLEEGEKLIYSMYYQDTDEPVSWVLWDGFLMDRQYQFVAERDPGSDIENSGRVWEAQKVKLYPVGFKGDESACLTEVIWYSGLGTLAGFTNQLYGVCEEHTSILKRVVSSRLGVVFEANENAGVGIIEDNRVPEGIKYRIDGTRFQEGEKGMYIMNGKKYIAR